MIRQGANNKVCAAFAVMAAIVLADQWAATSVPALTMVSNAEARVGRPVTPRSVAGVARRTTRRTIRRSSIYVAALPAGCVRTTINGITVSRCGGTYYQPYGGRYVVIYVD